MTTTLRGAAATTTHDGRVGVMADSLIGSEILRINEDVKAMIAAGREVCNLTAGDFSPKQFPVPRLLRDEIAKALAADETNYPPPTGIAELRHAVRELYAARHGLDYPFESVVVTGGSRPGIYCTYRTLIDPGDRVVYPVPSWNNNHYVHLSEAEGVPVVCGSEDLFLPTADHLRDAIRGARLLVLNSPLNPAGTVFRPEVLAEICDLVLEENATRQDRPLYLLFDQVYWMLTFPGLAEFTNPVMLRPEMRPYTILIDGISKAFAATGVRVGWVAGPTDVMRRFSDVLGHVGAWAPRAEQLASAAMLRAPDAVDAYHAEMRGGVETRLRALHEGLTALGRDGFPVEAIAPMGGIYLSVRFDLIGSRFRTNDEIRRWLLEEAGMAVVPFQAFGVTSENGWFRISVGTVTMPQIEKLFPRLRAALQTV
jgi:aspartate aminotransferase